MTLKKDGQPVAVTRVKLDGEDAQAKVTFKFEPREVGEAVYSIEVPEQPGPRALEGS